MHTSFLLELLTKALQDECKDQSEATILAANAKPTRPMKGVTMDKANCPNHTPAYNIEMREAKSANGEPGAPTGPSRP
jgi:hypothetical protein